MRPEDYGNYVPGDIESLRACRTSLTLERVMADMSNAFRDVGAAAVHAGAELERAFTAFGQVIVDAVEPDFALDEAAVQAVSQAIADQNEQRVRELLTMAQTPVLTHAEKRLLMGLDPEPPRAPGRRAINFQLE